MIVLCYFCGCCYLGLDMGSDTPVKQSTTQIAAGGVGAVSSGVLESQLTCKGTLMRRYNNEWEKKKRRRQPKNSAGIPCTERRFLREGRRWEGGQRGREGLCVGRDP